MAHRKLFGLAVEVVAVASVPCVLLACALSGTDYAAVASVVTVVAALAIFFAQYETSSPRLRDVMPTVILAALAAAGRVLFAPFPDFKPVSAIAIIAGVTFGRRSGFMVGALAALVSNFFFGQGPWTPWQMYAWGLVGYGAGLLAQAGLFRKPAAVYAYGFASALMYGALVNLWSILGFFHAQTGLSVFAVYAAALPFDILHGVATALFLLALYTPWKKKLQRVRAKYGLL
jgi:energy-coupling factor transport system substrate-specific component